MGNFDEADFYKAYLQAQGKYDETATISSISNQIGRKLQARKQLRLHQVSIYHQLNTPPLLTQEVVDDEDISLLGIQRGLFSSQ